jgi:hypothetical protein
MSRVRLLMADVPSNGNGLRSTVLMPEKLLLFAPGIAANYEPAPGYFPNGPSAACQLCLESLDRLGFVAHRTSRQGQLQHHDPVAWRLYTGPQKIRVYLGPLSQYRQIRIANAPSFASSVAPLITSCLSVVCWGASIRVWDRPRIHRHPPASTWS